MNLCMESAPMGLFRRRPVYDRARIIDAAARARVKKKWVRAIELYRWVLAMEPQNGEIHAKLAPLLARTGQHFDAWNSFKVTARIHLRNGHPDKALAVYRDAARHLPREPQAWLAVARLQHKRGAPVEAVETLLEGSRQLRSRRLRPQAIHLLRRAREVNAWSFEVVLELARLLASTRQLHEAWLLLDRLAQRSTGERLRRARGAQLRLSPSPAAAWRWLQAALQRDSGEAAAPARPSGGVVPLRKPAVRRR
jgi:Tfp pilus assembly protein PilF